MEIPTIDGTIPVGFIEALPISNAYLLIRIESLEQTVALLTKEINQLPTTIAKQIESYMLLPESD